MVRADADVLLYCHEFDPAWAQWPSCEPAATQSQMVARDIPPMASPYASSPRASPSLESIAAISVWTCPRGVRTNGYILAYRAMAKL
jgi:hypothetical protein